MTEEYYLKLTYRKLEGSISDSEMEELDNWRKSDPKNETEFQILCLAWDNSNLKIEVPELDLNSEFAVLENLIAKGEVEETEPIQLSIPRKDKPKSKINWLAIAAAFVLLFGAGAVVKLLNQDNLDWKLIEAQNEIMFLSLEDGSTVKLHPNSTLRYPEVFGEEERIVELSGEAFFEISENKAKPFVVETEWERITVLGTSFNVREAAKENQTSVFVLTGKVSFESKEGKGLVLLPGEEGKYTRTKKQLVKKTNVLPNAISWISNELVFNDSPLKDALEEIGHYYNIEIDASELDVKDCLLTAHFNNQTIQNVLETLKLTFNLTVEVEKENHLKLSKGLCN